jgi:hypothetical protein
MLAALLVVAATGVLLGDRWTEPARPLRPGRMRYIIDILPKRR